MTTKIQIKVKQQKEISEKKTKSKINPFPLTSQYVKKDC